jgi:hypothetical protein
MSAPSFTIAPRDARATALVIANGPSLRGVDLKALSGFATFGMNAAYRHWRRIGWFPTRYACLDEVVGLSHAEAIGGMIADHRAGRPAPSAFCLRRNLIEALGPLGRDAAVTDFDALAEADPRFYRPPVTTGSHTLLWALSLGFRRLFLIGADATYVEVVPGARKVSDTVLEIVREASNPNYFFDDYQQPGDRYHLPNIGGPTHLRSWRVAAAAAAELEAEVYNLSPDSAVDAFDFASLDDLLAGGDIRVQSAALVAQNRRRPA